MMTYFCDKCDVAIPLDDINKGLAQVIAGKLYCKTCLPDIHRLEKEKEKGAPFAQKARIWLCGGQEKTHYISLRVVSLLVALAGIVVCFADLFWMVQRLRRFEEFTALLYFAEGMFALLAGLAVFLLGRALADIGDNNVEIEDAVKKVRTSVLKLKKSVEELEE